MKTLLSISLIWLISISNADVLKSYEEVAKKEIRECILAQIDTHDIYKTIEDSSFKTYSELAKIIAYRDSLLLIVEKCNYIYDFHADVEHANTLAVKVAEAIANFKR